MNGVGLSIIDLIHGNWARILACSTTVALAGVYLYLNQFGVIPLLKNLITVNIVE